MSQICQVERKECNLEPIIQVDQSDSQGAHKPTLRALFDAEESALLQYAFSLVGRRAVAEEIVQEVFLQLHSSWKEIDSPRAWLFRSVRNRAYNHNRDNKREILSGSDSQMQGTKDYTTNYTTNYTSAKHDSPVALFLSKETAENLRHVIEQLDKDDRQLVHLKYFENLKYREISRQTGLSIGNVGFRLHHILKGLAEKLRQLGIDEMS